MPKTSPQINDTLLKSLKPKENKYFVSDNENMLIDIHHLMTKITWGSTWQWAKRSLNKIGFNKKKR